MNKKNTVSGIAVGIFFLFLLIQSFQLDPQAALWPKTICIVGLLLTAGSILLSVPKIQKAEESVFPLNRSQICRALIILAVLVVWGFGITTIGFLGTSIACMAAVFLIFDSQKNRTAVVRDLVIAAAAGLLMYFLFRGLGVHFPKSLLL